MGNGAWAECAGTFTEEDLHGQECYAGLDSSSTSDISSVCYAFPVGKTIMLISVIICRSSSYRTPPIKTALSIASGLKRAGYAQRQVTASITTGSEMTSCRMRRNLISGWWALIRGTPRISGRNYRGLVLGERFPQTYLRFSPAAKSFEVFVNRRVIVHRGDPASSLGR